MKWKEQNCLEWEAGIARLRSKFMSFVLCCSAVSRRLRCILSEGPMWQCWAARTLPQLWTATWQILKLLSSGTPIQTNVPCSKSACLTRFADLLVEQCSDQSVEICWIPRANLSVSCYRLYMMRVLRITICCMVQVVEHWMPSVLIHSYVIVRFTFEYGCTVFIIVYIL